VAGDAPKTHGGTPARRDVSAGAYVCFMQCGHGECIPLPLPLPLPLPVLLCLFLPLPVLLCLFHHLTLCRPVSVSPPHSLSPCVCFSVSLSVCFTISLSVALCLSLRLTLCRPLSPAVAATCYRARSMPSPPRPRSCARNCPVDRRLTTCSGCDSSCPRCRCCTSTPTTAPTRAALRQRRRVPSSRCRLLVGACPMPPSLAHALCVHSLPSQSFDVVHGRGRMGSLCTADTPVVVAAGVADASDASVHDMVMKRVRQLENSLTRAKLECTELERKLEVRRRVVARCPVTCFWLFGSSLLCNELIDFAAMALWHCCYSRPTKSCQRIGQWWRSSSS
jgi:hypothetical protein